MIAEYKENVYIASIQNNQVVLVTFNNNKKLEGFEPKRDYFRKVVQIDDPMLISLYEIHYWVLYRDSVEPLELWKVDEEKAIGLDVDIENEEVVINVNHAPKDKSWTQYERGASEKKIKLADCDGFFVEKKFFKRNGKIVNNVIEKSSVTLNTLKNSMIMNRNENL